MCSNLQGPCPPSQQMDQIVIEGLQHLRLTEDKEEDIPISTMNKSNLMEECTLSLFGKLLSDKQQNQRALKSTLRATWKMGFELRIVDVGKDILQFKFTSEYQMEWVERNGPRISTIIFSYCVDGRKDYQFRISPSLTPLSRSKSGASHLKTYWRKLEEIWGIAWAAISK
uniref:DUF4283 domain-containing protein n=1 Tax=Quercus lobata TaxID=97700 RepID=A0A7N2LG56_QUELO